MKPWRYTLSVSDVWKSETLTFEQQRDEIVKRVKRHVWYFENDMLRDHLVPALAVASTTHEFDTWWAVLYDMADDDRVWVETR